MLTWWNSQTLGTQFFTWRKGQLVGEDEEGNRFYRNADDSRRWVVYNGEMEASRVSPEWHGWLHRTFPKSPVEDPFSRRRWERPHEPNLTGSPAAYAPPGSLRAAGPGLKGEYTAWVPKDDH